MAETRTDRFGLVQWGAGTDSPSRADFNEALLNIETNAAYASQSLEAERPTPTISKRIHLDTDTGKVIWDDGANWRVVGSHVDETLITPATNQQAFIIRTLDNHAVVIARWGRRLGGAGSGDNTIGNYINQYGSLILGRSLDSGGRDSLYLNTTEDPDRKAAIEANKTFGAPALLLGYSGTDVGTQQDFLQVADQQGNLLTRIDKDGDFRSNRLTAGRQQPPFCKMIQDGSTRIWDKTGTNNRQMIPIKIGRLPFPADFDEVNVDNFIRVNYGGWYHVEIHVDWNTNAYGSRVITLVHRVGGGVEQESHIDSTMGAISGWAIGGRHSQGASGYVKIDPGDRVGIGCWQNSGKAIDLDPGNNTWLAMRWIAPA